MKSKFEGAFSYAKKALKQAFSLVELMVTLIVISCIMAALVPSITKKLKSQGITVGGSGGGGNLEFNQDCSAFGTDCALCFDDRCSLCTKVCESFEYVSTADCVCKNCIDKDEKCISCTSKACNKCDTGYGLDSITKTCKKCETNQYSDGTTPCALCLENHYCNGSSIVMCPSDSYSPVGSTSCTNCATTYPNCIACNSSNCLTCRKGYKLKDNICTIASGSQIFTTAGEHEFTVPEGIDEVTVTLVSGGAGGGGGAAVDRTDTFVISGDGNIPTVNERNVLHTSSTGLFDWTIPESVKGTNILVSACGGGGANAQGRGGDGGSFVNSELSVISNWSVLKIQVGGAGGSGINGVGGGADPLFAQPNTGGGAGGSGGNNGETGSLVRSGAGGAGAKCQWFNSLADNYTGAYMWTSGVAGAQGGNPTMFLHTDYAKNTSLVAGGGGGGGGKNGTTGCTAKGGGGGGGGGITGGAGGANESAGVAGTGAGLASSIFGGNYCTATKNGAMRITYFDTPNGGTGGGAGMIVPKQKITVTEGQVLVVTVGAGGAGGDKNVAGTGANATMISKIAKSDGTILLTTSTNISTTLATGGNSDGTTVGIRGYITNGKNTTEITMDGFSNTNGSAANGKVGGMGGKTTLEDGEMHCLPGGGGTSNTAGSNATGYGGCGGGGGGAGAKGGAGAPGYVKISWGDE